MNRRRFLSKSGIIGLPGIFFGGSCISMIKGLFPLEGTRISMISSPPLNHFFGYFGVNPWNAAKSHLLSLETSFNDRLPNPGEKAAIGLIDMATGSFKKVSETTAWNMQQGCMFFWNPIKPNEEFYYNDIINNKLVSVLFNLSSMEKTVKPYSISGLTDDGKYAINLDYGRISRLRKVVSYSGTVDDNPDIAHPANSGVFVFDLKTGERKLVVSYKQVADEIARYAPEIKNRHMWIEHAEFNPDGTRFLFLPRTWDENGKRLETGMYTIGIDGKNMRKVIPYGKNVSHWSWRNNKEIVATFKFKGTSRHVLFTDNEKEDYKELPGMDWDGHCTFDRSGRYMVTDNKKDRESIQNFLWLYDMETDSYTKLATFDMVERRFLGGDTRCDLHPRWSDDSKMICVDAIHPETITRQIFIVYTDL